jgi:polar amino acid transport system permease protein
MQYDWNFDIFIPYKAALLNGLWITIELAMYSSVIGTIIGILMGVFLRFRPLKFISLPINDILRAIPILVLIYLFYYFPYTEIFGIVPLSAFTCVLLALTLAQVVFTADIVRASIDNVPEKTILGARSLGFKEIQIWQYVIIPDITRQTLPTQIAFYIGNLKYSSLASVIATPDILYVAKTASAQNFRSLEAWVLVAIVYIILVLPLSYLARKVERSNWLKRRG